MSLSLYHKKRDFKKTPEPESGTDKASKSLIFVVQRHKASHLHYDFRLEMNGTMKSWAVPKGPSMNPKDKRLAMMVEDHPVSYASFQGLIPEGNYGAGIVEIWDSGTYELGEENKNGLQAIKKGSLKVVLKGKKLKGKFALVQLKNAESNSWLLIKDRDTFATDEDYNSELETPKSSPINKALQAEGKTVGAPAASKRKVKKPVEVIETEAEAPPEPAAKKAPVKKKS